MLFRRQGERDRSSESALSRSDLVHLNVSQKKMRQWICRIRVEGSARLVLNEFAKTAVKGRIKYKDVDVLEASSDDEQTRLQLCRLFDGVGISAMITQQDSNELLVELGASAGMLDDEHRMLVEVLSPLVLDYIKRFPDESLKIRQIYELVEA